MSSPVSSSARPAPTQNRLRQIAILLASVDSKTAQQLLLHLPTETAKKVRGLSQQLGPISAEERQAVLAEFQRSASQPSMSQSTLSQPSVAQHGRGNNGAVAPGGASMGAALSGANPSAHANAVQRAAETPYTTMSTAAGVSSSSAYPAEGWTNRTAGRFDSPFGEEQSNAPPNRLSAFKTLPSSGEFDERVPWNKLSVGALVRFLSTERPPVIAVVISQLQPEVAVQVLLELPNDTNEAVLTRLANLEAVDADALASIDEYLSDRLIEYQRTLAGEEENQRRLSALLAAAPLALRDRWQAVVFPDKQPPKQASTSSGKSAEPPGTTAGLGAQEDILSDRGRSPASANMEPTEQDKTLYHRSSEASAIDEASISATTAHKQYILETGASSPIEEKNSARVTLPFPRTSQAMAPSQSIEFERILQLTPSQLASVLSRAGSRTVLLALAGATPQFMLRFDALLVPKDAAALRKTLQSLGEIHLPDVDAAQQRILQLVDNLDARQQDHSTIRAAA